MLGFSPRTKVKILWCIIHAGIMLYVYTLLTTTGSLKCAFWFCATSYFNLALYGIIIQEKVRYSVLPIIADIKNTLKSAE